MSLGSASGSLWPKAPLLVDKLKCEPQHTANKIHRERPVKFLGVFFLATVMLFAPCAAFAASHKSHHSSRHHHSTHRGHPGGHHHHHHSHGSHRVGHHGAHPRSPEGSG